MIDPIENIAQAVTGAASRGDFDEAWNILSPHRADLPRELELAKLWVRLYRATPNAAPHTREALAELAAAWPNEQVLIAQIIDAYAGSPEALDLARRSMNAANAAPTALARIYESYAAALRVANSGGDEEALAALDRAEALNPAETQNFERGLLHKSRGRFREALSAFQSAEKSEVVWWNIAITATAARDQHAAREAWTVLGFDAGTELGRCKVRLANDPPEESWAQMRSPCHGVLLTPASRPLAADYGDLVVWDVSPVGVAENKVPIFPLLTKLEDGGARKYYFWGPSPDLATQAALRSLSEKLPDALWLHLFSAAADHLFGALIVEPDADPDEAQSALIALTSLGLSCKPNLE